MISAVVSRYPLSCNSNALTRRPRMLVMTRKNEHEREFAPPQQQNLCENNGLAADTRYCCQEAGTRAPVLEAFSRRFTLTVRETVQRCASLCGRRACLSARSLPDEPGPVRARSVERRRRFRVPDRRPRGGADSRDRRRGCSEPRADADQGYAGGRQ